MNIVYWYFIKIHNFSQIFKESCQKNQLKCKSGVCDHDECQGPRIPTKIFNDNYKDCEDGSDESGKDIA